MNSSQDKLLCPTLIYFKTEIYWGLLNECFQSRDCWLVGGKLQVLLNLLFWNLMKSTSRTPEYCKEISTMVTLCKYYSTKFKQMNENNTAPVAYII